MPFTKGKCANPNGRPRRVLSYTSTTERLSKFPMGELLKIIKEFEAVRKRGKKSSRQVVEYICAFRLLRAMKHEETLKNMIERVEGKVPQPVSNPDGTGLFQKPDKEVAERLARIVLAKSK